MQSIGRSAVAGIVVYAVELERLVSFYAELLGLPEVERGAGFVTLADGACEVNIVAIPSEIAAGIVVSSPPRVQEDAAIKAVVVVSSLDAVVAAATRLGGGTRPRDTAWEFRGLRRLDGHDPEGNVVQFAEPIA